MSLMNDESYRAVGGRWSVLRVTCYVEKIVPKAGSSRGDWLTHGREMHEITKVTLVPEITIHNFCTPVVMRACPLSLLTGRDLRMFLSSLPWRYHEICRICSVKIGEGRIGEFKDFLRCLGYLKHIIHMFGQELITPISCGSVFGFFASRVLRDRQDACPTLSAQHAGDAAAHAGHHLLELAHLFHHLLHLVELVEHGVDFGDGDAAAF